MSSPPLTGLALRRAIIEVGRISGVGHLGSALSVADIIAVLFGGVLRDVETTRPDRDRFILSKGHAALALYAALHARGLITRAELESYCRDDSLFGVHPEHGIPTVELSTGSLGMGLGFGTGLAISMRRRRRSGRVFVLMSDAECNEGSVWESVMLAAHQKLDNLVAIVDQNGMQALGNTDRIVDMEPVHGRWSAFGWNVQRLSGHDEKALAAALAAPSEGRPSVVIADTILGRGVSFMEGRVEWHYYPVNDELARRALADLEKTS